MRTQASVRIVRVAALFILLLGLLWAWGASPSSAGTTQPARIVRWLEARHLGPAAVVIVIAMLPIFELRGSIPVAVLYYGMPVWKAFVLSILGNMIPIIPIILLIRPVSNFLTKRSRLCERFFTWMFERARRKGSDLVEKYEMWGLAIFVGIPLPATGAWTGAFVAFVLRMHARRAFWAIFAGVLIAGIVVTLVTTGALSIFRIFVKA